MNKKKIQHDIGVLSMRLDNPIFLSVQFHSLPSGVGPVASTPCRLRVRLSCRAWRVLHVLGAIKCASNSTALLLGNLRIRTTNKYCGPCHRRRRVEIIVVAKQETDLARDRPAGLTAACSVALQQLHAKGAFAPDNMMPKMAGPVGGWINEYYYLLGFFMPACA
jgi:hypothetical protein